VTSKENIFVDPQIAQRGTEKKWWCSFFASRKGATNTSTKNKEIWYETIEEYYDVENVYRSPTNYTIKFTDKSTFLLNPNYIKAIRVSNIEIDDEITN